jgi:signal transduction histidine kinase/CheY-like chemotaxis protein
MSTPAVLVVDDEPGIALLCKRVLSRAGYEVTALTDPRQAVAFLKETPLDLLLVDIRMPEVDGFEVIAHARQHQPDIAILVMTGFGTVETAIRALRQGVDGLILKPFQQTSELVEAARQALDDNQKKRDAARIRALRPLFEVTESLFSEIRRDPLLQLVVDAICMHLHCSSSGCLLAEEGENLQVVKSQGKDFPPDLIEQIVSRLPEKGSLLTINVHGPGDSSLRDRIRDLGLGAAIFVLVRRPNFRVLFWAARELTGPSLSDSDVEMFQILARQAAAALENARLYAEQVAYVKQIEASQKALLQAEKMAAAGRLTASIAHEINNPLQSVQNCLHLAGREDLSPQKRKEYFNLARSELERLMTTVRRMLDFARPASVHSENVDLMDVLQRVLSLMLPQLNERKVVVEIKAPDDLPYVRGVNGELQQVFINLLLNAYDVMPNGGRVEIIVTPLKTGIEILFQDSGPGIPKEQQANIFEPFFSTKESGTGLGLTVSYNIVAAHGGSLSYVAEREPGACFRVFLPYGGNV